MFIRFKNREDAAMTLIPYLDKYKNERSVVLAVPRGGVPIAYLIARHYNFPLELLMTKKISYPGYPEFAIGAVSLEDHILDDRFRIPGNFIAEEVKKIRTSLQERYKKFVGDRKPVDLENKVVIIVDDGMATGNTILTSISMLRKRKPKKIVVAVPVAPPGTVAKMKTLVDEVICLYTPENFIGVGLHYQDFSEVKDEEVIRLLRNANHFEDVA